MTEILEKLKSDQKVYYIYENDLKIYGLEDSDSYKVIVDPDFNVNGYPECFSFILISD